MKTISRIFWACLWFPVVLNVVSCAVNRGVIPEKEIASDIDMVWSFITVTGSVVNLRSGPGTDCSVLGQVHAGDSLQVTGGTEDWYRVYIPDISLFAWIYGPLTSGTELP